MSCVDVWRVLVRYGRRGVASFVIVRPGEAWLGMVRHGRHGTVCQGRARQGNARLVQLWYDMAVLGKARCGRCGASRRVIARLGKAGQGVAGMARSGFAVLRMVRRGMTG